MTHEHHSFEAAIIEYLTDRRFVLEQTATPGEYSVIVYAGRKVPTPPRLVVPEDVLAEYLTAQSRHHQDEPDPLLEALSLLNINIEEHLVVEDTDGRNRTRSVGVRRAADGTAELFVTREKAPTQSTAEPSPDLEWRAVPPEHPSS